MIIGLSRWKLLLFEYVCWKLIPEQSEVKWEDEREELGAHDEIYEGVMYLGYRVGDLLSLEMDAEEGWFKLQ